ncbi:MAG TPA: hypothetical protein VGR72_03195 [Candidatus Acidoferrales bacterium]|nr:hypothetical protein [Candidatus Acidoferrales bacterium]
MPEVDNHHQDSPLNFSFLDLARRVRDLLDRSEPTPAKYLFVGGGGSSRGKNERARMKFIFD